MFQGVNDSLAVKTTMRAHVVMFFESVGEQLHTFLLRRRWEPCAKESYQEVDRFGHENVGEGRREGYKGHQYRDTGDEGA